MAKICIAMRKRFESNGILYTQDCLTGQIIKKQVVQRDIIIPIISTTEPVTHPVIEIPQFFLAWQERRDNGSQAK